MFYKIELNWIGSDFQVMPISDLEKGWEQEYDLLHELDEQKYYLIKPWDLPGNLVNRTGYENLKLFANYANPVFCAIWQKG